MKIDIDKKIKKMINCAKYVSFDLFDTLILRMVDKPSDVFVLTEKTYEKKFGKLNFSFKNIRVDSENEARKLSKYEEITIEEIYLKIAEKYDIDNKVLDKLKKIEIDIEENITKVNYEMYEVYKYSIKKNKEILITSDMYLHYDTIAQILKKYNIEYKKLYVSSKIRKTKNFGTIYNYMIKDLQCNPSEIFHIGDNKYSDYKQAKKNKLRAYYYRNCINKRNEKKVIHSYMLNSRKYSNSNNYWFEFGYKNVGILYYSFIKWIVNDISINNSEKILFFSRDGYIMKVIYDLFAEKFILPPAMYFYASRRALNIANICELGENEKELLLINTNRISMNGFFKKIGLKYEDYEELLYKLGFESDYVINEKVDKNRLDELLEVLKDDILKNSKCEREAFYSYIDQNSLNGINNISVVDIGWNGTLQKSFYELMYNKNHNINVNGYYLGTELKARKYYSNNNSMQGFLFDLGQPYKIKKKIISFNSFFEQLFIAPHGSVIKYDFRDKNNVIFDEFEYSKADYKIYNDIQEGAVQYIKDVLEIDYRYDVIEVNPINAIKNLQKVFVNPSLYEAEILGNLIHFDYEKRYNAKPNNNLFGYIVRPHKFIKDLKKSLWKPGFLKQVFKVNIYKCLINLKK